MEQSKKLELVNSIAERVWDCGGDTYFVGGYVRDKLLGIENKDIDVEVHGITADVLESILAEFGEVLKFGATFGVYNIRGYDVDIALPRTERKMGDKHVDFEVIANSNLGLRNAAMRRDFTINSIMENVLTGLIVDYFNGCNDLDNRCIRHINDDTFKEDVLRVLRAAQFAARFDFIIADETMMLCKELDLSVLSRERVFIEMEKALLKAKKPSVFFEQLRAMGQLDTWFPELMALIGAEQNVKYHQEGDVWNHTMLVLDEAAKHRGEALNPMGFMLAALCHDMGKPMAQSVDEIGIVHTYGHEKAGLTVVERFLRRLTSDKKLIAYVLNMVELHMEPNIKAESKSRVKSTNKMFDRSVGPFDLIMLAECDCKGKYPICADNTDFLLERLHTYYTIMARPYIMGRDLVALGFESCAEFKEVLEYAHKLRLACVNKEDALKQVAVYARKKGCVKKNDNE